MRIKELFILSGKRYVVYAIAISALISLVGMASIIYPLLYKDFIDALTAGQLNKQVAIQICILFGASLLLETILTYIYLKIHTRIEYLLRYNIYCRSVTLSEITIKEKGEGYFVQLIDDAVYNVVGLITPEIFSAAFAFIKSMLIVGVLFYFDRIIAIVGIIVILLNIILFFINNKYFLPKVDKVMEEYRNVSSILTEHLSIISLIQTFPIYSQFARKQFSTQLNTFRKHSFSIEWYAESIYNIIVKYILPFARVGILVYAGSRSLHDIYSIGTVVMIITYVSNIESGVGGLSTITSMYFRAMSAMASLSEFIKETIYKKIIESNPKKHYFFKIDSLRKSFNRKEIFSNLNIELKNNIIYGLVGQNGAGKSTFLNILIGLDQDFEGTVSFLNNKFDIKEFDFIPHIAILRQDAPIINSDLLHNVTMGSNFNEERYNTVIKDIGIENLQKRILGIGGKGVSGGERRKINIARFLYSITDKDFFILDESFVSLDSSSRRKINEIVYSYTKGKTGIIVSHDEEVINLFADEILEFDETNIFIKKKNDYSKNRIS